MVYYNAALTLLARATKWACIIMTTSFVHISWYLEMERLRKGPRLCIFLVCFSERVPFTSAWLNQATKPPSHAE